MKSPNHQQLMQVLNKLATAEKWSRMPKKKGILLKKEMTKSGNIKLILKTKKGEETVYVLKKNKNLYVTAQELTGGASAGMMMTSFGMAILENSVQQQQCPQRTIAGYRAGMVLGAVSGILYLLSHNQHQ